MTALTMLELRRQRVVVARLAALTIAIGALFYVAGKRSPTELLAAMIGSSIGAVLVVPMGIARDKLEGTLDFIRALPIGARDIAASRLAAMAIVSVPWAVGVGGVFANLHLPATPNMPLVILAWWLVLTMMGAIATAFFALFDLEQLLGAPLFGIIVLSVLVPRAARVVFPNVSAEVLLRFLRQPTAPFVITGATLAAIVVTCLASFAATERGFANYRPRSG
jgi:hypothetical protein